MQKKQKKYLLKKGKDLEKKINFLFEARSLKYIPRACLTFLKGVPSEDIAQHTLLVVFISWVLAGQKKADQNKVIKMALLHDLAEVRAGEKNLINKFYTQPLNEEKIIKEISQDYFLDNLEIQKYFKEYQKKKTIEAKIVKDADILAQMFLEKEAFDLGNFKAKRWLSTSLKRLETKEGIALGKILYEIDSDKWWLEIIKKYILLTKFLSLDEPFFHLP